MILRNWNIQEYQNQITNIPHLQKIEEHTLPKILQFELTLKIKQEGGGQGYGKSGRTKL